MRNGKVVGNECVTEKEDKEKLDEGHRYQTENEHFWVEVLICVFPRNCSDEQNAAMLLNEYEARHSRAAKAISYSQLGNCCQQK